MSYIEMLFGKKNIADLNFEDVQNFFSQDREETDKIEFKSFHSVDLNDKQLHESKNGVLRAICAFLNSEGGVVIWGAPNGEKKSGRKEKIYKGEPTLCRLLYEKDSFISIIANKITPSPRGILFHKIERNGLYVYVIEVQRSDYAPHQFEDVYWMRMDGQTHAAPHHYIEALFKKISFPNIEAFLRMDVFRTGKLNSVLDCRIIFRNQSPYQNDLNPRYRVFSSQGHIVKPNPNSETINYGTHAYSRGEFSNSQVADIISYGDLVDDSFQIIFSPQFLYESNYEVELLIIFGARYSPMKSCNYKLRLHPEGFTRMNDCIVDAQENIFFHGNEKSIGIADDERLRNLLGR